MNAARVLSSVILSLGASICLAQSPSYRDADNLGQALNMMNTYIVSTEYMQSRCVAGVPALTAEVQENVRSWKEQERDVIRKTEYAAGLLDRERPQESRRAKDLAIDAMGRIVVAAEKKGLLATVCQSFFRDLASGVWRKRTPSVFRFIDEAPPISQGTR